MESLKEVWPRNEFERFVIFSTIRLKSEKISLLESLWKSFTFPGLHCCERKFLKIFPIISSEAYNKFIYLLWLTVRKSSFLQNVLEEARPGCRNRKMSLIMVNLSKIFLSATL